ncbi:Vitamin K-dependent gamma-carboxylase [Chionoecetes opilio]|uniref:Vitamin K-dependent gamma-carboxylase n=1 Tax=Chionoecetes opilio TaxID=41210 RepID=A0A8J4XRE0_CHIOP|nr:Vitamin K-dependent gamma-carboxylase [Chionoecetes opilio]
MSVKTPSQGAPSRLDEVASPSPAAPVCPLVSLRGLDGVTPRQKVTTVLIACYLLLQLVLPFSHSVTKGFNTWTEGPYGYSWDMMVHSWDTLHVKVTAVTAKGGHRLYVDPNAGREAASRDDSRIKVRQSWREDSVKVLLAVPPGRRRHVIGPRGDAVHKLRQDFPKVRVTVPLPQDRTAKHVSLEGPKSQVAAAAKDITGRLEVIEAQLREAAERRKKNRVKVVVDVAPNTRRHVVGPRGRGAHQAGSEIP